jgi:hypothetical protein
MAPRAHLSTLSTGSPRVRHPTRGSVLVVALLIAALIALILGSYLNLNLSTARLSQRTFDRGAAFHLAEAGLEEGLWSYNQLLAAQPDAWDGWDLSGDAAWRRFGDFELGPSTRGSIKIYAQPILPTEDSRPQLVALASVQSPGGAPITQMLEVTLRRRSFFGAGLVARDNLSFRGGRASFDSWDSDPDADPATPPLPYSPERARDNGAVAVGATDAAGLELRKARIHGYLHTRSLEPLVESPGLIGPFGTADGAIDSARVGLDYNDSFPALTPPAGGLLLDPIGDSLGTDGLATSWRSPSLRLSGNRVLTIHGDVTLVLTDPADAFSITGGAGLELAPGATLTLYLSGDVMIAGRGQINPATPPVALQFWSTANETRRQSIKLAGQGSLSALVYAPEADFTAVGNAEFFGALIARRVTFSGNAAFHYDQALARVTRHAPWRGSAWRSVDDPAARAALLPLVDR